MGTPCPCLGETAPSSGGTRKSSRRHLPPSPHQLCSSSWSRWALQSQVGGKCRGSCVSSEAARTRYGPCCQSGWVPKERWGSIMEMTSGWHGFIEHDLCGRKVSDTKQVLSLHLMGELISHYLNYPRKPLGTLVLCFFAVCCPPGQDRGLRECRDR